MLGRQFNNWINVLAGINLIQVFIKQNHCKILNNHFNNGLCKGGSWINSVLDYINMHNIKLTWLKRLKDHEELAEVLSMDKIKSKKTYEIKRLRTASPYGWIIKLTTLLVQIIKSSGSIQHPCIALTSELLVISMRI